VNLYLMQFKPMGASELDSADARYVAALTPEEAVAFLRETAGPNLELHAMQLCSSRLIMPRRRS